jgi:hypothetical protein
VKATTAAQGGALRQLPLRRHFAMFTQTKEGSGTLATSHGHSTSLQAFGLNAAKTLYRGQALRYITQLVSDNPDPRWQSM